MERVALILLLFVSLMNGRHPEIWLPGPPVSVDVRAESIPLYPADPNRRTIGELRYLGGWAMTSDNPRFGGISSMRVDGEGRVIALSDGGEVLRFRPHAGHFPAVIRHLPAPPHEKTHSRWRWDTESMAYYPWTDQTWVGFEAFPRICRFDDDLSRMVGCVIPDAMTRWPRAKGAESLVRLPDNRMLAIAEDGRGPAGGHDVLVLDFEPGRPDAAPPIHLGYKPPRGYLPTDAVVIAPGRMLVMNRRLTLAELFTGVLTLVDIHDLRPGTLLPSREVARFTGSVSRDNFEALALSREGGRPVLWIASDDNSLFFQRSLLLKFAMPEQWFNLEGTISDRAETRGSSGS